MAWLEKLVLSVGTSLKDFEASMTGAIHYISLLEIASKCIPLSEPCYKNVIKVLD